MASPEPRVMSPESGGLGIHSLTDPSSLWVMHRSSCPLLSTQDSGLVCALAGVRLAAQKAADALGPGRGLRADHRAGPDTVVDAARPVEVGDLADRLLTEVERDRVELGDVAGPPFCPRGAPGG